MNRPSPAFQRWVSRAEEKSSPIDFVLIDKARLVSKTYRVIATMSSRGQIVIPQEVRESCQLREGDHFAVEANPETQAVTLRKIKDRGDWFDVYMQCPESFEVPPRRRQYYRRKT